MAPEDGPSPGVGPEPRLSVLVHQYQMSLRGGGANVFFAVQNCQRAKINAIEDTAAHARSFPLLWTFPTHYHSLARPVLKIVARRLGAPTLLTRLILFAKRKLTLALERDCISTSITRLPIIRGTMRLGGYWEAVWDSTYEARS